MKVENKKNAYVCANLHVTVTIDRDNGITPNLMPCPKCNEVAESRRYRINQDLPAAYEFFKPTEDEWKELESKNSISAVMPVRDHVSRGGLIHRALPDTEKPVTGLSLISQERFEQIEKHKRTVGYDVRLNKNGQLTFAAGRMMQRVPYDTYPEEPKWWSVSEWHKMMDKPYFDRLVIAGALVAAEIDRLLSEDNKDVVS